MEDSDKDAFFQRFKRKVAWRPEDEEKIKKIFHSKASHILFDMFNEARKAGKRPLWVGEDMWNQLVAHWNSATFRVKSTQASLNRASEKGGTLHTSGSTIVHNHAKHMAKEFGRSVHIDEVFQQTHIRKDTGQFVDERSNKTYEDFVNKFSQAMSEAASSVDESHLMDPGLEDTIRSKCWSDAVGGMTTKGRLYGARDLARHLKDTQSSRVNVNLKRKASCSSSHDIEEIVQLKQRLAKNDQRLVEKDVLIRQLQQFQSNCLAILTHRSTNCHSKYLSTTKYQPRSTKWGTTSKPTRRR